MNITITMKKRKMLLRLRKYAILLWESSLSLKGSSSFFKVKFAGKFELLPNLEKNFTWVTASDLLPELSKNSGDLGNSRERKKPIGANIRVREKILLQLLPPK